MDRFHGEHSRPSVVDFENPLHVRGVVAASGVPLHLVSPSKWKRLFGLDADKERSRALALRLWPARSDLFGPKKDHGRAEAALLARYAAATIAKGGGR
jgi:crossover junction endodeoxyribonuclease RuvC